LRRRLLPSSAPTISVPHAMADRQLRRNPPARAIAPAGKLELRGNRLKIRWRTTSIASDPGQRVDPSFQVPLSRTRFGAGVLLSSLWELPVRLRHQRRLRLEQKRMAWPGAINLAVAPRRLEGLINLISPVGLGGFGRVVRLDCKGDWHGLCGLCVRTTPATIPEGCDRVIRLGDAVRLAGCVELAEKQDHAVRSPLRWSSVPDGMGSASRL